MTFNKRVLLAACLLMGIALWLPTSTGAATGSAALAAANENGRITRLDLKTGELVVGDSLFKLSNRVAVYDTRGVRIAANSLKKGLRIAFNIVSDGAGANYISAIWILPAN